MGAREGKFLGRTWATVSRPSDSSDLPPNIHSVSLPEELLLCVCVYSWVSGYLF